MLGIRIETTYAKMAFEKSPSNLSIEKKDAALDIETQKPEMTVYKKNAKLHIDNSDPRSARGMYDISEFTQDSAGRGKKAAFAYIAKKMSDGAELKDFFKSDPRPEMYNRDAWLKPEIGSTFKGTKGPSFEVEPAEIEIEFPPATDSYFKSGTRINSTPLEINISYTPSVLKMYVAQRDSIRFWTEENDHKIDIRL